jgi:hypothetical protein
MSEAGANSLTQWLAKRYNHLRVRSPRVHSKMSDEYPGIAKIHRCRESTVL